MADNNPAVLYYVHDPMCSWCWGFRPVWLEVQQAISEKIEIKYLLGGLAPDSEIPMPAEMQSSIRGNWQRIQQEIPETQFNYDFWDDCQPRRSTYPACRAMIACKTQNTALEKDMLMAIQQAYYLYAKNPSDDSVLIELAQQIGLDTKLFAEDIQSENCQQLLLNEIKFCREIQVNSFPSLLISHNHSLTAIGINYNDSQVMVNKIFEILKG